MKKTVNRILSLVVCLALVFNLVVPQQRSMAIAGVDDLAMIAVLFVASCGLGWKISKDISKIEFSEQVKTKLSEYMESIGGTVSDLLNFTVSLSGGVIGIPKAMTQTLRGFTDWLKVNNNVGATHVPVMGSGVMYAGDYPIAILGNYFENRYEYVNLIQWHDVTNITTALTIFDFSGMTKMRVYREITSSVDNSVVTLDFFCLPGYPDRIITKRPFLDASEVGLFYDSDYSAFITCHKYYNSDGVPYIQGGTRFNNALGNQSFYDFLTSKETTMALTGDYVLPNTDVMADDESYTITTGITAGDLTGYTDEVFNQVKNETLTITDTGTVVPPVEPPLPPVVGDVDMSGFYIDVDLLKTKFPFSLPWDIANMIDSLVATREAPVFTYPFEIKTAYFEFKQDLIIDLTDFTLIANIIRFFLSLSFIVGLIYLTKYLIG